MKIYKNSLRYYIRHIDSEIEYAIGVYEKLEADNKRLSEENEILRADLRSATSQLHEIETEYQRIWAELQGLKEPDTNPTTRTYPDAITP